MGKVNKEHIEKLIEDSDFNVAKMFDKTTVLSCKLPNGFVITESSSCVNPADYDEDLGVAICIHRIKNRLWELEGYLSQNNHNEVKEKLSEAEDLLTDARSWMDDTHGYNSEVYKEIGIFLHGEDEEEECEDEE